MKVSTFTIAVVLGGVGAACLPAGPNDASKQSDKLSAQGAANLQAQLAATGFPNPEKCNKDNVAVRREWSTFTPPEKKDYIAAVQCLIKSPSKTPATVAPGAKTRYDDFVANHINQTISIHGTGNFLTWHRYFVWSYEQALRNECGYKGFQPYYNWPKWSADPKKSPVFDGSDTSIGGDGALVPGRNNTCVPSPTQCFISIPPGNGGGCVTSGPFKDFTVNLGPLSPALDGIKPNPNMTGLGYNPRCLRRDISSFVTNGWSKDSDVTSLINDNTDFASFSTRMQGDFANGFLGVHTAGHFTGGGDPGGDLFASPGDPYFFFHHAMIDRTYWTWQNLDLANRQNAIGATITLNNLPPSRNATLADPISMGFVGVPDITIGDATNTLAGPFCYIYA